jgi:hypothetical protein
MWWPDEKDRIPVARDYLANCRMSADSKSASVGFSLFSRACNSHASLILPDDA